MGAQPDGLPQHGVDWYIGAEVLPCRLVGEHNAVGSLESCRRIARGQRQGEHAEEGRIDGEDRLHEDRVAVRDLGECPVHEDGFADAGERGK